MVNVAFHIKFCLFLSLGLKLNCLIGELPGVYIGSDLWKAAEIAIAVGLLLNIMLFLLVFYVLSWFRVRVMARVCLAVVCCAFACINCTCN